jgi:2-succinyl-6-hydroxy-2,4-cyclohexadiene-1-carboxylate synthase
MNRGLVLLHGFTGTTRSFEAVLGGVRARAIVPALLGHGAAADDIDSFEAEVDRLAGVVRDVASAPPRLVGYSLGARLAIGLLLRHPELFRDAVLIGAQPGLTTEAERVERRRMDERWCRLLLTRGIQAFIGEWQAQPLFDTQARLPAALLDAQRRERLTHDAGSLVRSLRTTGLGSMPSYWDALGDVAHPLHLVVGELDTKFVVVAERMAERLPRARMHVVPGAGHNVVLERPDALASLIHAEEAAA